MEVFPYLSVLVSIILGLAITQVLQNIRALLLYRRRVRLFWPALVWVVVILMVAVQMWWALFDYYDRQNWSFAMYASIILQTTVFYLASGMALPDITANGADLRKEYFDNARWFFTLLCATAAVSAGKDYIMNDASLEIDNFVFHAGFFASSAIGAFTKSEPIHKFLAPIGALGFGAYILLLFSQIQ